MGARYWVKQGRNVRGPLSAQDLKQAAASGELAADDLVSVDRTHWVPAAKVEGLNLPVHDADHTSAVNEEGRVKPINVESKPPESAKPKGKEKGTSLIVLRLPQPAGTTEDESKRESKRGRS